MWENVCFKHEEYLDHEYVVFYFEDSLMQHFCGYVKVPESHPAYKHITRLRWFNIYTSAKALERKRKKGDIPLPIPPKSMNQRRYRYNYDALELNVHGGLTFGEKVTKRNISDHLQPFTPGFWVGWDYSHAGDEMYLPIERIVEKNEKGQELYVDLMAIHNQFSGLPKDRQWTWEEVEEDCKKAVRELIAQERGAYDTK